MADNEGNMDPHPSDILRLAVARSVIQSLKGLTPAGQVGLQRMIRHDFRRTAVRNLVNAGVPERVAMTITGHRTREVFDRYHIVSPSDLQEESRKLSGPVLGTNSGTASLSVIDHEKLSVR